METTRLSEFQIAETKTFEKSRKRIEAKLYIKIKNIIYPQLRINPSYGPNIKRLKGDYEGVFRYRIGSYRLFYRVDENRVLVILLDIRHRQSAYS